MSLTHISAALRTPALTDAEGIHADLATVLRQSAQSLAEAYTQARHRLREQLPADRAGRKPYCALTLRFRERQGNWYLEWSEVHQGRRNANGGGRLRRGHIPKKRGDTSYNLNTLLAETPEPFQDLVRDTEMLARRIRTGMQWWRDLGSCIDGLTEQGIGDRARAISAPAAVPGTLVSIGQDG